MSLTDSQREAVQAPGSVAITAGAGTGKTHTLGHRYLQHLQGGLSPLQIVAVTFTERAAAELRARVRTYAARELPEPHAARIEIEAAQISTLHALAARICREHPDAAGVPPDFRVLDELDGSVWLAERLDEALAALPAAVFEHVSFARCKEALETLLAAPLPAARALEHGPERWAELVARARAEALRDLTAPLDWREAALTVRHARGAEGDKAEDARQLAARGLELLGAGEVAEGLACIDQVRLVGGRKSAWADGELDIVKDALKELRDRTRDALKAGLVTLEIGPADDRLAELLPHLRAAFEQVRAGLKREKDRARVLDFNDLEVHALQALDRAEVRAHYARRWRALLVDEFQDTNPVQAELLNRLAGGMRVTLVGDEKQGIYGFRGADVAVFRRERARIRDAGGHDVVLDTSFRAHVQLTARLNDAFAPVLGELHQPLAAQRQGAPHPAPHLRLLTVDTDARPSKAQRQLTEARAIAQLVRGMIDAEHPVHDPDTGELRPLRPRDVAILTRTWSPLDVYGEVLPGLGVPAVHTGGGDLLATREAKDALALLRFLADPRDDLALAALLRSPFFAVSDRVLHDVAQALPFARDERPPWWDALQDDTPDALERPVRILQALLDERRSVPPSRALQLADRLTGYTAVLANLPGAARREADWSGFLELVRTLEHGLRDVFTVARRLRRLLRAGVEVPRPTLEAGDAVTLMTIHRSKGLEWPLVILADCARKPGGRAPRVRFDASRGVALELRDRERGEKLVPALFTLLARDAAAREEAEAGRLLYVALTRARDHAVVTATDPNGGALDLLLPGLEAAGIEPEAIPFVATEAVYPEAPPPEVPEGPDDELWRADLEGLGGADRGAASEAHADTVPASARDGEDAWGDDAREDDAWELAEIYLESTTPDLLPVVHALKDAGLPGPPDDGFDLQLTVDGAPSGHYAPLAWRVGDERVALVDAATPDEPFDARLVRVDPDDPEGAVRDLRAALAGAT